MADRKKIVGGLEKAWNYIDIQRRTYNGVFKGIEVNCFDDILTAIGDAVELLKAQEPRLVTESDFNGEDEYGYIPVWTEEKDGDMYWECIPKVAITDPDGIEVLRYWTSRPTDEQREKEPWNG